MRTYGYKCDRCGEVYDDIEPSCQIDFRYPSLADSPTADLCYGCTRRLKEWLDGATSEKTKTKRE